MITHGGEKSTSFQRNDRLSCLWIIRYQAFIPLLGEADTPPCGNADKTCQPDTLIILTFYYSLDNFRNRQRSPLRTLCRSIDCQSVHPPHRLGNKHGRASAIFGYFPLSFPHTLTQRKRDCVSKKAQTQRRPRMCIDRAPAGVKAPGERKVYPKRHFIAVPVSLVLKPTTRTEIQKTVQTIVTF